MTPEANPDDPVRHLSKENASLKKKVARLERNMQQLQFLSDNNSRLLQGVMLELEKEKERLEKALNDLKEAQTRLVQSEKMASLGALTAGIAHEIQNPLNFVNNFSELSRQLCEELTEDVVEGGANLDVLKEIAESLHSNLERIHRNGQRASAIVAGMLALASPTGGNPAPTDLNQLLLDTFNVAYSNFRAANQDLEIRLNKQLDPDLGPVNLIRTDIARVLVNLYNNAFDALRLRAQEGDGSFEPEITLSTKQKQDSVSIEVRDNGPGIRSEIVSKVFDPFFTTKKGTAGSGLGLAVSYDIITGGHGGEIDVVTEPSRYTAFRIRLPRDV